MNFEIAKMLTEPFAIEPNFAEAVLSNKININKEVDAFKDTDNLTTSNNNVVYQKVGNVGVISIDGVMYKKQVSVCYSVVSYDNVIKAINVAERDEEVETILFRVDTLGGSVAGAEEVREKIASSTKKTITFFENIGASAGMWIFTASDEIYASKGTRIGSIGVLVVYRDEDTKTRAIVSSNAKNKVCDIKDKRCQERVKHDLDYFEGMFLNILENRYKDKNSQKIIKDFNNGDVIFVDEAKEKGYIDDVLKFTDLLKKIDTKGELMETENNQENIAKEQDAAITAADNKVEIAKFAVAIGLERGASKEAIIKAIDAKNEIEAENIILKDLYENSFGGSLIKGEAKNDIDIIAKKKEVDKHREELIQYAKKNKIKA